MSWVISTQSLAPSVSPRGRSRTPCTPSTTIAVMSGPPELRLGGSLDVQPSGLVLLELVRERAGEGVRDAGGVPAAGPEPLRHRDGMRPQRDPVAAGGDGLACDCRRGV